MTTPQQPKPSEGVGKTLGVVALAAVVVGVVTYLVSPAPVKYMLIRDTVAQPSNWPTVYKWGYKTNINEINWRFYGYTTNTTELLVAQTNGMSFFTITEYFLTGLPVWMSNSTQFHWYRTNQ